MLCSVFLDVCLAALFLSGLLSVLEKRCDEEFCNLVNVKVTQLGELSICTGSEQIYRQANRELT